MDGNGRFFAVVLGRSFVPLRVAGRSGAEVMTLIAWPVQATLCGSPRDRVSKPAGCTENNSSLLDIGKIGKFQHVS